MKQTILGTLGGAAKTVGGAFGQALKDKLAHDDAPALNATINVDNANWGNVAALTCPNCSASVAMSSDRAMSYCPYCGAQLAFNDGTVNVVYRTIDEAKLKKAEAEAALKLRELEIEEQRRPGRLRLMAILAILGALMILVGYFVGATTGDSNSPWYMMAMLGFFPLMGVVYIWISMQRHH